MKRTLIPLLVVSAVALSGCATIRAHNPFRHKEPQYKSATQERPLEIPPGMNAPPTTDALVIPNAGSGTTAAGTAAAQAEPGTTPPSTEPATAAAGPSTSSSLALSDTPDSVYHRVGLALARGDVGQVRAHDDSARTYQVMVDTTVTEKPQGGFLHRLFHHDHTETVQGLVVVSVVPHGTGSVINASGNANAVARVMAMLHERLK
ncbi:MAG TPA: hypothetical protein VF292_05000 [Rhodanobacteraceae bacterium]